MKILRLICISLLCAAAASTASAQAPHSAVQKNIEAYLRHLYALGDDVQLTVGPLTATAIPDLMQTTVDLKMGDNKQTATLFVSKDGKYIVRGELSDLTKDPLAETRAKLKTADAPALGPATAPVTLVEFSDFECPVCRQLHDILRNLLPKYPQVKVIFKDFPIEQLHPWARTAALAGRCAYRQDPKAFWKVYDMIYDNQDVISAENAWDKMLSFAGQAALNQDMFKSCMASPEAAAAIEASRQNGIDVEVNSTPTIFVNGRRLVGTDAQTLQQYIDYEIKEHRSKATGSR